MRFAAYVLYALALVLGLVAVWQSQTIDGGEVERRFWRDTMGPMSCIGLSVIAGAIGNFCALNA